MPIKGIKPEEEIIIKSILEPYKSKYEFYYYGSRVKGNFRFLSDLDILVTNSGKINLEDINFIKEAFDKSLLPYIVNLTYNPDNKFYKLIQPDLVQIF